MREIILKIFGGILTISGIIIVLKGDLTNGLLIMILAELVYLPYRIKEA